jgi:RNA polymerase sigma-70 factor (ECF subfamily)
VTELLDRYGGLVYSLARRFCYQPSEIEDAVQEVFVALWESGDRFDPALGGEDTFIATITRRRLIDRRRRSQRRGQHLTDADVSLTAADAAPVTGSLELSDEARRAGEALATLRPEQQRCLRLSIYQGLSHEEIAQSTGIPLGTVKTHVRRGLIALREALEKHPSRASDANS